MELQIGTEIEDCRKSGFQKTKNHLLLASYFIKSHQQFGMPTVFENTFSDALYLSETDFMRKSHITTIRNITFDNPVF